MKHYKHYKKAHEILARLCPNLGIGNLSPYKLYVLVGYVKVGSEATDDEWRALLDYRVEYQEAGDLELA